MRARSRLIAKVASLTALATLVVSALGAGCGTSSTSDEEQGAAGALRNATGVEWIVSTDPETGAIRFAAPKAGPFALPAGAPEQTVLAFLDAQKAILKMHDPRAELIVDRTDRSEGLTHLRFRQQTNGVAIEGGTWSAHLDAAGRLTSMSGNYVVDAHATSTSPSTTAEAASATAKGEAAKENPAVPASELTTSSPTLVILPIAGARPVLVWSVSVTADARVALEVHVDASSGAVRRVTRLDRPAMATGAAPQTYPPYNVAAPSISFPVSDEELPVLNAAGPGGVQMQVVTIASPNTPIVATQASPWMDSTTPSGAAIASQAQAKIVLEYLLEHSRNDAPYRGVDGQGLALTSVINGPGGDYARWDLPSRRMFHSDGTPADLIWPSSASLDVAAHELAHGVTQFTTRFVYAAGSESAALEESMSDVFAALVAHRVGKDDAAAFAIGEDTNNAGKAFRSMITPSASSLFFSGPSDIAGFQATNRNAYAGASVTNHAFYLLTHGDVHAISRVRVPCGIGWAAADRLYWALQTSYAQPGDTFKNFALHSLTAARDLAINQAPIACAWVAVGVLTDDETAQWNVRCERDGVEAGAPDASDNILVVTPRPLVECSVALTGSGVSLGQ